MVVNFINYIRDITKFNSLESSSRVLTAELPGTFSSSDSSSLPSSISTTLPHQTNEKSTRKTWGTLYALPDSSCQFSPIMISQYKRRLGRQDFNTDNISISTCHFTIALHLGTSKVTITDLSKNGTYINGSRVPYNKPIEIQSGCFISLAQPDGKLDVPHFIFYRLKPQARPNKTYQLEHRAPTLRSDLKIDVLSSELECFLCKQIFTNSLVFYPCFHSFCGACVLFEKFPTHCSLCNALVQDVRPNHILNNIAEGYLLSNPRFRLSPTLEKTHEMAKIYVKKILDVISQSNVDIEEISDNETDGSPFHFEETYEELLNLHLQENENSIFVRFNNEKKNSVYQFLKKRSIMKDTISTSIAVLRDSVNTLLIEQQRPLNSNNYIMEDQDSVSFSKKRRPSFITTELYNQLVNCSQCFESFHLPSQKEMVECTFCKRNFCSPVRRCLAAENEARNNDNIVFGSLITLRPSRDPINWAWGNDLESEMIQIIIGDLGLNLRQLYEKLLVLLSLRQLRWENTYLASRGATLHSTTCQDCLCDLVLPELVFLARGLLKPQHVLPKPLHVKDCPQGRLCQEQKVSEHHRVQFNHYCPPNPFC